METIIMGVAALLVGLVSVFSGFRLFRILLAVSFLFVGFVVGQWLVEFLAIQEAGLGLLVTAASALLLAGAAWSLFSVAVYLAGALLGISVATQLGTLFGADSLILFGLGALGAFLGGSLATGLKKTVIILGTAFIGSSLVLWGADAAFGLGLGISEAEAVTTGGVAFGFWLLLGITGAAVQYQQSKDWQDPDAI